MSDSDTKPTREQLLARVAVLPQMTNAKTIADFSKLCIGELSFGETIDVLSEQIKTMQNGNLNMAENMLFAQAQALNTIFTSLATLSATNIQKSTDNFEMSLRLALKAQAQCRATLETLAVIKNPPTMISHQTNIAGGHQQVNNMAAQAITKNPQNELLEANHGNTLDTRTPPTTSAIDSAMATVETIERCENTRRKAKVSA